MSFRDLANEKPWAVAVGMMLLLFLLVIIGMLLFFLYGGYQWSFQPSSKTINSAKTISCISIAGAVKEETPIQQEISATTLALNNLGVKLISYGGDSASIKDRAIASGNQSYINEVDNIEKTELALSDQLSAIQRKYDCN